MEDKEKKIQEQVEQRLQEQQAKKEFKDIGRVANLKKSKAALKFIDVSSLNELELDEVQAFNMVKKDTVWLPIDVNAEKEKGYTAGATYFKVELRKAAPSKPINSPLARKVYVTFLTRLQTDLANLYDVKQIEDYLYSIANAKGSLLLAGAEYAPFYNVIEYLFDSDFSNKSDEQKKIDSDKIKSEYRNLMFYGTRTFMSKLVEKFFSKRFANVIFYPSDLLKESKQKEPITEEQSKELIEAIGLRRVRVLDSIKSQIEDYSKMNESELKRAMNTNWKISPYNKAEYLKDIEKFREWVKGYFERNIKQSEEAFEEQIKKAQPKDNDWSWAEIKKDKKESTKLGESLTINKKEPLSYIKRTGGYAIEDISPKAIVEQFGYSAVNYGNYVDDIWSKQHTKYYLQAMSDLGEIMNFSVKDLNKLGGLSLVFGGKGRAGHAAAYYPQTKDINLTKTNGDGSVAHEYAHYMDNVIVDLDIKRAEPFFATENTGKLTNPKLYEVFTEIVNFMEKGKEGITPRLTVTFYASKNESKSIPDYFANGQYKQLQIKDTIESTIEEVDSLCVINESTYQTQLRVFGYIIKHFGLESYEVKMRLKTSMFYQKTAYQYFKYCYEAPSKYNPEKTQMFIGAEKRSSYWTSRVEMFARSFETVVLKKLVDKGRRSDYLVNDISLVDINMEGFQSPYPSGAELDYFEGLYDKMISVMKETINISDFVPLTDKREDLLVEFDEKKVRVKNAVDTVKSETTEEVTFTKDDEVVEVVEAPAKTETPTEEKEDESMSKENLLASLEGAKVAVEFLEGQQKQDMIDYIEGLETLIEIL